MIIQLLNIDSPLSGLKITLTLYDFLYLPRSRSYASYGQGLYLPRSRSYASYGQGLHLPRSRSYASYGHGFINHWKWYFFYKESRLWIWVKSVKSKKSFMFTFKVSDKEWYWHRCNMKPRLWKKTGNLFWVRHDLTKASNKWWSGERSG